jgi:vancomycin permeability regulator SanA
VRRRLLFLALFGLAVLFGGRVLLLIGASGTADAADAGEVPALKTGQHRAAVVFGAGLNRDGQPSALLRDRVQASVALLRQHEVDTLLMTGDNSRTQYSEPSAMRAEAMELGVPADAIAVDYGGRRTWDSCERAKSVFGVRNAITVTNDFHRARTVVLCKSAGITIDGAVGTSTGKYPNEKRANWEAREVVASWRGVSDAWIKHPAVAVRGGHVDPYDACSVYASLSTEDRAMATKPSGCPAASTGT